MAATLNIQSNPPFHPSMLSVAPVAQADSLKRGMIVEDISATGASKAQAVRFMYNPSELDLSHTMSTNTPPPAGAKDPNDVGTALGYNSNSLSFSLLFDRTYDLWDSSYKSTSSGQQGVYVDIEAFYRLTRVVDPTQGGVETGTSITGDSYTVDNLGPMQWINAFFYFGQMGRSLSFYGYITNFSVSYTHWTVDMVPMRAVVSGINVTLVPTAGSAQSAGLADPNNIPGVTATTPQSKKATQYFIDQGAVPASPAPSAPVTIPGVGTSAYIPGIGNTFVQKK